MATSNLPKAVLSSPGQNEANDDSSSTAIKTSAKFHEMVKINCTQTFQELHQTRIKNLRKELDHLKETEWKYEPIDKYLGLSS